jgi:hypothetical protein
MPEMRRVWVIEEVKEGETTGHRQTMGTYTLDDDEDGSWHWDRPDDQLTEEGKKEWDRVVGLFKNVGGQDMRHLIDFSSLLDHCNDRWSIDCYRP